MHGAVSYSSPTHKQTNKQAFARRKLALMENKSTENWMSRQFDTRVKKERASRMEDATTTTMVNDGEADDNSGD